MPGRRDVSTGASSLERAFRERVASIAGGEAEASQLDLLRGADGKLPSNVFQLIRQGQAASNGPGRPVGAGNKRNQKLAQLIVHQHGDPVLYMASIYAMPTDQLVELLRLADDSAAMEERLYALAEKIETHVAELLAKASLTLKQIDQLGGLVDRLGDIAKVLRNKPGDLAVKALALQVQAAKDVATYVHQRQPVALQVTKRTEGVLLIPGLNAPVMDPKALEGRLRRDGLDAVDMERLELLPVIEGESGDDGEGGE
jgi:hypothetical protein